MHILYILCIYKKFVNYTFFFKGTVQDFFHGEYVELY